MSIFILPDFLSQLSYAALFILSLAGSRSVAAPSRSGNRC